MDTSNFNTDADSSFFAVNCQAVKTSIVGIAHPDAKYALCGLQLGWHPISSFHFLVFHLWLYWILCLPLCN